jgi:hypothetical protein
LQPLADEVVDGAEEQRRIVRELLRRFRPPARHDDGCEIVRAEVLFDEVARVLAYETGANGRDVQIVQDDDIDAPGRGVAIGAHVGGNGAAKDSESIGPLDRQLDVRERLNLLRLAVLEHFEVVSRQARHELTLRVDNRDIDVDRVDRGPECRLLGHPRRDHADRGRQRPSTGVQGS